MEQLIIAGIIACLTLPILVYWINQTKNSTLDTIFTCVGSLVDAVGMPLLGMLGGSDKQSCVSYSNWHRISSDLLRRNQASGWKESPLQPTVLAAGLALALVLLS